MPSTTRPRLMDQLRRRAQGCFSGPGFLLVLAVLIGLGGGIGAWGFRWLIEFFTEHLLVGGQELLGSRWLLPLIPAFGGALVGFIVLRYAPEAKGHGVPEVMAAVATQNGRIRPRVVVIKCLASALCIGTGGSVGREGPIVQIGSALGSTLGQLFRISPQHLKVLVGCGAAAGISATFNAPIAGAIFALEVILGDFRIRSFSPIIISSVLAAAFARHFEHDGPAFVVPAYEMVTPLELPLYAALGILAGLAAVAFTKSLYWAEDRADALRISNYLKPILGGALVGAIAIAWPQVLGVGYGAITEVLYNRAGLVLVAVLLGAKFLATCLTLSSGGSGGVFAPSLFLGAMLGGGFGILVNALFPGSCANPGAYALVGMAAVVGGTTHAPLSAMLILFELTDDYKIILPLMLATTLSTLMARRLDSDSIYTRKLSRRGLSVSQGLDKSTLQSIRAAEVLNPDYDSVAAHTSLGEIVDLLQHSEFTDFPVLDEAGAYRGLVSFEGLRTVMLDKGLHRILTAADVMDTDAPVGSGDATLLEILEIFSNSGINHIPIVESADNRRLLGVLTRARLLRRYDQELRKRLSE